MPWIIGSSIALNSISGCHQEYPSINLKKDYPALTEERKSELENKLLKIKENDSFIVLDSQDYHENEPIVEFSENVQEFINHLTEFRKRDNQLAGVSYPDIGKIDLSIIPFNEIEGVCGKSVAGCHKSKSISTDQIYMPDNLLFDDFLVLLYHEIGHTHFKSLREYPAVANELYMTLKTYQFSKEIGSSLIDKIIFSGDHEKSIEDYPTFQQMYIKARFYAIHNLMKNNGDIEKATDKINHNKWLFIETDLENVLSKTPGDTDAKKMFNMWNQFLENSPFLGYLISNRGHLNYLEARELIDYM